MIRKVMIFLAVSLVSAQAFAAGNAGADVVYSSQATRWELDSKLGVTGKVLSAETLVDLTRKQVILNIVGQTNCPPNAKCLWGGNVTKQIVLPIVSMKKDVCGNKIVRAATDNRMVDGILEQLTVTDLTQNHCPTFTAYADTDTVYETDGFNRRLGTEIKTRSLIQGGKLVRSFELARQIKVGLGN